MMEAFTRNYDDNSTEAGFQFTFYCDVCHDGFKSSFIESQSYQRGSGLRNLGRGAGILGNLIGGRAGSLGWAAELGGSLMSERFEERSPEWRREHEQAFIMAQNEARQHFWRCHGCNRYVCISCFNENEGLCTDCAPRQDIYVAKARAEAMRRNIDEAGQNATVWQGQIESKTTVCPQCGKPAGNGRFCNNCGASMDLQVCSRCGAKNAQGVKFCNNCGNNLAAAAPQPGLCTACGTQNAPGTRFCGECGNKLQ